VGSYLSELLASDPEAWSRLRDRNPSIELVASTVSDKRTVDELEVTVDATEGRWPLPVAVVSDISADGEGAVRAYFSTWPLTGQHEVSPSRLPADPTIVLTGAVADYQRALAAGDLDEILAAYESTATVREPSGGPYVFVGHDRLREIYTLQFANGGGIPLEHCTATDDGTSCAIEYNAVRWGSSAIPPQAGVAVYVRGDSGKLSAARIYDDVEPPEVSDSSLS
jgi:hypothetical protein